MGEIASIGSAAVWAVASVLFARLGNRFDPLVVNAGKCLLGLACFFVVVLVRGALPEIAALPPRTFGLLALSAVIGLAVGDTAFFQCMKLLGARRALLMTSLVPPMTGAMGVFFLGEPFTPGLALGMAVTVGGVAWVVAERTASDDAPLPGRAGKLGVIGLGVMWGLLAQVGQAVGAVLTKLSAEGVSALSVSTVRLSFGVLALLMMVIAAGRTRGLVTMWADRSSRMSLVVATFLGTFVGIWLMNIGILRAPIGVAATLLALSPVFVLPLAAFWVGERVSLRAAAGAVVAVLGIALLFALR
jgi:drug/metabolite transporter (DMT)-like permease